MTELACASGAALALDLPEVVAEVRAAFAGYEAALVANDVAALDAFFWVDARALRYGIADIQQGAAAIAAYRRTQAGLPRRLERTIITAFGRDMATVCTLFRRPDAPGMLGRQSQVWARLDGWRVVSAHISLIDDPAQV